MIDLKKLRFEVQTVLDASDEFIYEKDWGAPPTCENRIAAMVRAARNAMEVLGPPPKGPSFLGHPLQEEPKEAVPAAAQPTSPGEARTLVKTVQERAGQVPRLSDRPMLLPVPLPLAEEGETLRPCRWWVVLVIVGAMVAALLYLGLR